MQNTILEMVLDEIHESTNGPLKLLKVLDKELITVGVDDKLFLILYEILTPIEKKFDSDGDDNIEALVVFPNNITIKLVDRARIHFMRNDHLSHYTFQIIPQ